jgi:Flp pilus assembly protein TadB
MPFEGDVYWNELKCAIKTSETGFLCSRHVTWRGRGSEFSLPGVVVVAAGVVVVAAGVVVVAAGVVVVAAGVVVVAAGVVVVSAFAETRTFPTIVT